MIDLKALWEEEEAKRKQNFAANPMLQNPTVPKYQEGGNYNINRAKELGYQPDETGHMPSVDDQTGAWLKSKEHPTAWMEYLHATLNHNSAKNDIVVVDPDGYFGNNQLQYVPRNKYQDYKTGGSYETVPKNYITAPASTTSIQIPPIPHLRLPQKNAISGNQRPLDKTLYPSIPYGNNTTAVETTYADTGALLPSHYIDKVKNTVYTGKLKNSMISTAIRNMDLSEKYYKNYAAENIEPVKELQRKLVAAGLDIGKKGIDGKFGDDTLNAYKKSMNTLDLSDEQNRGECRNLDGSYKDGCAEYVSEVTKNRILGSAWEMAEDIESQGGVLKYNIYDDPSFKNVKNVEDLKRVTSKVKATSKAKAENFEVGDVVGIYWKDSKYHQKAMNEGKRGTKNTHVGIVTSIKNGVPIISHNIHGKLHHEPYNHLTIGWIGSTPKIPELTTKDDKSGDIEKIIDGTVEDMPGLFNMDIDKETLRKDIQGILKVESNMGKHIPTDNDIKISLYARKLLGNGGIENISTGIAKIKSNALSPKEKVFLGFDSKGETIADDIKATTYLYLKHYTEAKKYAASNPDLKLTEEDIRSMAILGHNQGMDKLLTLGSNSFRSKEDEVQMLREISKKDSFTKDISSTKFKHLKKIGLGALGDQLYNAKYPQGHRTYVGRVKSHGDSRTSSSNTKLNKYQIGGPAPASTTRVAMPLPLQPSDFYGNDSFTPLQPWAGAQFRIPSAQKSINQGELHKSPSIREKIGAFLSDLGTDFAYAPRTIMTLSPPTIEEYRANRSGRLGDSETNPTMNRVKSIAEGLTSAMEMAMGEKVIGAAVNKIAGPVGKANLYKDFEPGIVSETDDLITGDIQRIKNAAEEIVEPYIAPFKEYAQGYKQAGHNPAWRSELSKIRSDQGINIVRKADPNVKRPLLEKLKDRGVLPVKGKELEQIYAKQDAAFKEGVDITNAWYYPTRSYIGPTGEHYSTSKLRPQVRRKIEDILRNEGTAPSGWDPMMRRYSDTNFDRDKSPMFSVKNVLTETSKADQNRLKDMGLLTKDQVEQLQRVRGSAGGLNFHGKASVTHRNVGNYIHSEDRIRFVGAHEGGHTAQQLGLETDLGMNTDFRMKKSWGERIAHIPKDSGHRYYIPNPESELGVMAEKLMVSPRKGRDYKWEASPNELHSDLTGLRARDVSEIMKQTGWDMEDAIVYVQEKEWSNPSLIERRLVGLNRFFKPEATTEERLEFLKRFPAALPAATGLETYRRIQEQKEQ